MSALSEKQKITLADLEYLHNEARELIDGKLFLMSPGPSICHQEVSLAIAAQFWNYLKGKDCKVFTAPFDVFINENLSSMQDTSQVINVFQPDIFIVCDKNKLTSKGCIGAPDLVVEILSPTSVSRDWFTKLRAYEKAGVKEYWIVDPVHGIVHVKLLGRNGLYKDGSNPYSREDRIKVSILDDCIIDLSEVFG